MLQRQFHTVVFTLSCCISTLTIPIEANAQNPQKESYHVLSNTEAEALLKKRRDSVRSVDFHIHTSMKNTYNYVKSPEWLTDHRNDSTLSLLNWFGKGTLNTNNEFNNFNSYRQADFGILARSHASILATSITPIEKHLVSNKWPIKLLPYSFRRINRKVTGLPMRTLRMLYEKKNSSYRMFMTELEFLLAQQTTHKDYPSFTISVATDKEDLVRKFSNGETSLVLSLEGAHILHGNMISNNRSYDHPTFTVSEQNEIIANVKTIKAMRQRVFFITLGHFSWNGMVGSPKTLDMDNEKRVLLRKQSRKRSFREKLFLKYSDGIMGTINRDKTNDDIGWKDPNFCFCQTEPNTSLNTGNIGWRVIDELLDRSDGNAPIFVDVKHMDINARLQYYSYLNLRKDKVPIIASHVAVSGKDTATAKYTSLCPVYDVYEELESTTAWYESQFEAPLENGKPVRKPCLERDKVDVNAINWFYPWGINLAREEISIIYNSDGIIGIALEERVLGTNRPNYRTDTFARRLNEFLNAEGLAVQKDRETFLSLLPFFKNLFYIVQHSGRNDATAWDHVALGSDLDGIAKPVAFCKTAAEYPAMHALIVRFLPLYVKFDRKSDLLFGLNEQQVANKVMFENGERFILKYF